MVHIAPLTSLDCCCSCGWQHQDRAMCPLPHPRLISTQADLSRGQQGACCAFSMKLPPSAGALEALTVF